MDIVAENAQLKQRVDELQREVFGLRMVYTAPPPELHDIVHLCPQVAQAQVLAHAEALADATTAEDTLHWAAAVIQSVVAMRKLDYATWCTVYIARMYPKPQEGPRQHRAVWRRDHGTCQYCGTTSAERYHIDHVIPQALAGPTKYFNLVVACQTCNLHKSDATWIPANLDLITEGYPTHRARVLELAVPHAS